MASSSSALPKEFLKSIWAYQSYPVKLVERARYGHPFLNSSKKRLEDRECNLALLVKDENDQMIPIREVERDGKVLNMNLLANEEVLDHFHGNLPLDPQDSSVNATGREDPAYRAIFFLSASSVRPLEITLESLQRILTYFQVMPGVLDFLYVFGNATGMDPELKFSGFRTDIVLSAPHRGLVIDSLNRSGQRYQLCYTLKGVECQGDNEDPKAARDKIWKIRHGTLHHQFDLVKGTQLWILGDQKQTLWDLTAGHLSEHRKHADKFANYEQSFITALDMHLVYCRWAALDWRWYICSSEDVAHRLTIEFLNGDLEAAEGLPQTNNNLVVIQSEEEAVNCIIMVLESNADIMERLQAFYQGLVEDPLLPVDNPRREFCRDAVKRFSAQVGELVYDIKTQIARARVLSRLIKDRKAILIQHLQTQAASRQEASASSMWELAEKSTLEAIAVRIIAVITLIFLPATFIATVFSTDIVKYQIDVDSPSAPPERRSMIAIERFLEVSVPLMMITFGVAISWYKFEQCRRRRRKGNKTRV